MKVAIIGCGLIGTKRANSLPVGVDLLGCFDEIEPIAEVFANKFNTRVFKSLDDMLVIKDLDFVIIATRHNSLAPIALKSLKSGKHVFVEKPGALNYSELVEIQTTALKQKLKIHVGYNHRYHPGIIKAFKLFRSGTIGELMFIRGRYGHGGRIGYEKEWRANKSLSGGGELIDQGAHLIDLSICLMGRVFVDYAATPNYFWNMQVEDNAFLSLRNSTGKVSFLHASCTEWKNMFSMEIYGKIGKIEIAGLGKSYGLETVTLHKMRQIMGPPSTESWTFPEIDHSWRLELEDFINDLITDSKFSDNIESSIEVLKVIHEIYLRTGR